MDDIYKFLNNLHLDNSNGIVAAISGGPDSMFLLNILLKLKETQNFKLIVAHVNHNLREESFTEKEDLENYCLAHNLIFEFYEIEKRTNKPLTEVEARKIRYNFLDKLMKKYNADYLATAHHGDDLIETVMMKIVRGSSLKGYSGFPIISQKNGYKVIRPLISLTKKEIIYYLEKENLEYAIDKTNSDTKYTRNRFRLNVLPFLKNEDKNVHLKFKKFSETLILYDNFVKSVAKKELQNVYNNNELDLIKFKKLDKLLQKEIIYLIIEIVYKDSIELINEKHVSNLFNAIYNEKPNIKLNFPSEYVAVKEYDKLRIYKKENVEGYKYEITKETFLPNGKCIEIVKEIDNNSNYMTRINSSEICLPLFVRTRNTADKMQVKGMNRFKKIKDIYIDEKVPLTQREVQPIVVDSNDNVIWIPGIKKSVFDKKENEEYDIILRYF